jgi:hypothetical protein
MRWTPPTLAAVSLGLAIFVSTFVPLDAEEAQGAGRVVVTNFPPQQRIHGTVTVGEPAPLTRFDRYSRVVTPADRDDLSAYTEGELLDATGFPFAVLSLAGEVQGSIAGQARVGAVLVPDEPEILRSFREHGRLQFAVEVEALVEPSPTGLFEGPQKGVRLGFPRYRVFYYDSSPRSVAATLYVRLGPG